MVTDKLRPFLIFEGQPNDHNASTSTTREFHLMNPDQEEVLAVDLCCQQLAAWQDHEENIMLLKWIDRTVVPYLQEKAHGAPVFLFLLLLLLDHFSAHHHWTLNVHKVPQLRLCTSKRKV